VFQLCYRYYYKKSCVTFVTDSRIHTPIIMTLHVTREGVKNIQCNYRASLLLFLFISPFSQPSPFLYSSPYSYVTCKGPCSLSSSVGFLADWFSQNLPCNIDSSFFFWSFAFAKFRISFDSRYYLL
jgi:hypothetical protein